MDLDGLPENELKAVDELRRRLKGEMSDHLFEDDDLFIRFLRARNFDIDAAESMLRNHLIWRKTWELDRILTDYTPSEVFCKYMTLDRIGYDKEGSLILYSQFGDLDIKGLLKSISRTEVIKSIIHFLEICHKIQKDRCTKLGKAMGQLTFVCNLENLSFATVTHPPSLQVVGQIVQMYEAHYPERLRAAYLFNGSVYFTIGYAVVKPFISGQTVHKIKIFGKEGWKDALLELMGADTLPAFLGGNRTDPDGNPMCKTIIRHGGIIPERYHAVKRHNKVLPGTKKLTVKRMSNAEVTLEVEKQDSHIEWEFDVKGGDIDFSVVYKEGAKDTNEEVLPKQRIDTTISPKTGKLQCKRPGTYILEFDNTYSWIHQKEVFCSVFVKNSYAQDTSNTNGCSTLI